MMDQRNITQGSCAAAPKSRKRLWALLPILALILAAAAGGLYSHGSLEQIVGLHDRFRTMIAEHPVLAMAGYLVVYTAVVAISLPGAVFFTLAAGLIFGALAGGLIALTAATLGASIVYWIARSSLGDGMAAMAGPQVDKLKAGFCDSAMSYLLFLRLIPIFPFFVVNVVPALLDVPFGTFLIATFFGIMPATFAYSSAGAGLEGALATAKAAQAACLVSKSAAECPLALKFAHMMTPELKLGLAMLSVLALLPVGLKLWKRHNANPTHS